MRGRMRRLLFGYGLAIALCPAAAAEELSEAVCRMQSAARLPKIDGAKITTVSSGLNRRTEFNSEWIVEIGLEAASTRLVYVFNCLADTTNNTNVKLVGYRAVDAESLIPGR